jgi:Ras-related protein Rab-1A
MNEDDESDYEICKVVLLGESGVGKSSIITRYSTNSFSDIMVTTTAAAFSTKNLVLNNEHKIKFQLWDTAGQEKFRSINKIFYQNSAFVILVYDITRRESFDQIRYYWAQEVKNNVQDDTIIVLASNKNDLYKDSKVSSEEGKNLAEEIKTPFFEISAKSSFGIEDLFKSIAEKYFDPSYTIQDKISLHDKIKIDKKNSKKNKRKCC